jgi:glycosyltransferase involved in cell wall biosynthesis
LVKKGHRLTLFASGNSKTRAKLISLTKKGLISQGIPWQDWWWNTLNHSLAFQKAEKFDIIHCHWTPMGMFLQNFVKTPVINTLHNLPKKSDHRWKILKHLKGSNVVFVSKKEKKNSPVKFKREWAVYNGIDISQFKFKKQPKDYFGWIGRISPQKGLENAIKIAKKANLKLLIAGPIQPMYLDYFKKKIKPNLSSKIKYLGELSQGQLSSFYGGAKAILYPIEWQEPFGLIVIEAMACGTPVIAFDKGAMREIINRKTGFVVKNISEAIGAIKEIQKIKRKDCRIWVEKNFSYQKMVENYEKIYYQLISQ